VAIISICRGTQSGGQALAECLAEELQYPLVAREVLQDAASELGISEQELSRAMERAPRLWKRHASVRRAYIATIQAALAEHTVGGDLVYHGRAGQMLLAGLPAVLRVRLIAPMGARVSTLLERNEMTPTSAEEYIQHVDAARARWVKMMYGEDIEDPALYDMVINLQTLSVPAACNSGQGRPGEHARDSRPRSPDRRARRSNRGIRQRSGPQVRPDGARDRGDRPLGTGRRSGSPERRVV
jgi:cytidylate kinase